ncbi:tetratricopeptide repeat protein [Marinobacterium marinum]|uniref:Sel1 repeat family protein n=1 Tax=Marinobacterium marinum TaxID=2756129 RepID=A0A7W1WY54_9GAMM|nr:SEL1-like repeat protein [Marinobacterium marinum]MBA4502385.1 sel1 repeat family protein [Marinobacterium marinum]
MSWLMRQTAPLINGLAGQLFHLPFLRGSRRRHRMAMRLYRWAAEHGSRSALSTYGHLLHFRGEGVASRIQGGIYLERAADLGDAKAQYQMGRIYEQGFEHYFRSDPVKALAFYRLAGEQSHPLAVKRMIAVYDEGALGTAIDPARAECWRKRQAVLPGDVVRT